MKISNLDILLDHKIRNVEKLIKHTERNVLRWAEATQTEKEWCGVASLKWKRKQKERNHKRDKMISN